MFVKEHGDIDDVVPISPSIFEYESDIFEHGATLRFDIVTDHVACRVERHARNFLATPQARPDPGEKKQIADALCVRERTNWFRRTRTFEGVTHLSVTVIRFDSKFEFRIQNPIR